MKLEPTIQCEVSQKVKHQYSILMHIYMEFRKVVMMTLYVRQQKRYGYKEQTFGLYGRRWGWDDLRDWCWNMHITICEIDHQFKFDAWNSMLRTGALGQPWGMERGVRVKEGQDGEHTYTHDSFMSMYGKNYYNILK